MAFTDPTTSRVSRDGGGWLWMDINAAVEGVGISLFPVGGQGGETTNTAAADPVPSVTWITFYGFTVLTSPTVDTEVYVSQGANFTTLFTYDVASTTVAGNYFPAEAAEKAAWDGLDPTNALTGGHFFSNPGILIKGIGLKFADESTDDLKIRVWFRHETSF